MTKVLEIGLEIGKGRGKRGCRDLRAVICSRVVCARTKRQQARPDQTDVPQGDDQEYN